MEIVITQWAFNAYLNLKHKCAFGMEEFNKIIKPDVLLLKNYPHHTKFYNGKFWSIVSKDIRSAYKMKWHQVGNGRVQLRLPVLVMGDKSFLCEAYVKSNQKVEQRMLAKFKVHAQLIRQNRFQCCGVIV